MIWPLHHLDRWKGWWWDLGSSIALVSHRKLWSPSSSRPPLLRVALRIFLMDQISCSYTPPWCDADGGLKCRLISLCSKMCSIFAVFHPCIALFSSPPQLGPCLCPWKRLLLGRTGCWSSTLDVKWTKVVYPSSCKWWLIWDEAISQQVSHQLLAYSTMKQMTHHTLWQDCSDDWVSVEGVCRR